MKIKECNKTSQMHANKKENFTGLKIHLYKKHAAFFMLNELWKHVILNEPHHIHFFFFHDRSEKENANFFRNVTLQD